MNMRNNIEKALEVLRRGGLILYPTDTIWGIGCDARNEDAVRKVFELKKRSDSKSLVLLADSVAMIERYVEEIPSMALQLLEVNDAPMTLIYPGAYDLAPSCIAEDGTVGMRIPSSSAFCMGLLGSFKAPIVSTSANVSGNPSPRDFASVEDAVRAGVDFVVDRSCEGESTGVGSQIIKVDMDGGIKIIRA